MTVVAYGVDHGVDDPLNVVKGYGKPPTPLLLPKSAQKSRFESDAKGLSWPDSSQASLNNECVNHRILKKRHQKANLLE
jgi:hypothetical protein